MVSSNGTSLNAGQTRTLPSHLRYAKLSADLPEPEKRTPSQLAAELKGTVQLPVALKRPQVIELLNMSEYTHNVESVVPLDEPVQDLCHEREVRLPKALHRDDPRVPQSPDVLCAQAEKIE